MNRSKDITYVSESDTVLTWHKIAMNLWMNTNSRIIISTTCLSNWKDIHQSHARRMARQAFRWHGCNTHCPVIMCTWSVCSFSITFFNLLTYYSLLFSSFL